MKISRFVSILVILVGGFLSAGCVKEKNEPNMLPASFRDIPGITSEEISAIEELLSVRQSFSYGMLLSEEAYNISGDRHPGFTILFCDMLSELFGVPFVPKMHSWQEIKSLVDSYELDFTVVINATTDVDNQYYKTSPIIGNRLSVFIKEGAQDIVSEYDLRDKRVGFFAGSYSELIFRNNFPRVNFRSVEINTLKEMADKLLYGEIDAFIYDAPDVFTFYEYPHVVKVKTFPYVYVPVSFSTANKELEPVISAITKFLMAGGIDEVAKLNKKGERDYASFVLKQSLTAQEHEYISELSANGKKVPIGASSSRYPVAFFDFKVREFQGIALDVLNEISVLTGIEFEIINDEFTTWVELENMLKEGEIALISQLVQNNARREYAIWPDAHYYSARYAFLSNLTFPFLSINQVPYTRVGVGRGTVSEAIYRDWFPEDTSYKTYNGADEGLDALEEGEIDLYLSLDYTLLYESNYRENASQKINIIFDSPVEKVLFGLNKNEEILCSIISKAQGIINTDEIVRNWTSRIFDPTVKLARERVHFLTITVICLLSLLMVMLISLLIYFKLRKANLESRQNLQVLLDMLPVGVRILSLVDFSLLYSNKACLDIFGCTSFEEQVEGQNGYKFMPETQPDGRSTVEHMKELFKTDRVISEIQCLKLSGEPFICRMTSRTINYSDNKGRSHRASLAAMEDVTQERNHEKALQNAVVREHEANQLKSRFLAMMSHEIRTPMNAILGIAEIQLQNESLPSETEDALGRIYDSGNLLLNIINDILDLSKIEAGKLEIVPVKYNIPSLVNDVVQLNRLRYEEKPIEFVLDVDENTPFNLFGDELRIRQVLNNIISNAFKYTEKGKVSFSVSSGGVIQNSNKDNIVMIIFKITDTGQGMTQEHLEKLFEEYTRFNLDSNRTTVGTGLGMSITKKILDLMDGQIEVKSEYGNGSVFTVRLPQKRTDNLVCGKDTIEKLKDFSYNATLMSKKSRILREYMPYGSVLVVDDVETNIYVTKGMLVPYGLKVDTASSGLEAIDKIKKGNVYDVIFMDHMMPKMDGVKTTSLIRGFGYKGDIIALTANALVGQSEMFLKNGFDGYITKPIDSRELNHILNEFIRNKKPPEVVKAARREQALHRSGTKGAEPMEKPSTQEVKNKEVKQFFLMDAESAISVLQGMNLYKMEDADLDSYEITVHGMKSALVNINEKDLSAFALKLETAVKERDMDTIQKETPFFIDELKELVNKIILAEEENKSKREVLPLNEDAVFLKKKLLEIKEACAAFDSNKAKNIIEEIRQKTWPAEVDDVLDEINVYLLHNAYQKAASALDAAMEIIAK